MQAPLRIDRMSDVLSTVRGTREFHCATYCVVVSISVGDTKEVYAGTKFQVPSSNLEIQG